MKRLPVACIVAAVCFGVIDSSIAEEPNSGAASAIEATAGEGRAAAAGGSRKAEAAEDQAPAVIEIPGGVDDPLSPPPPSEATAKPPSLPPAATVRKVPDAPKISSEPPRRTPPPRPPPTPFSPPNSKIPTEKTDDDPNRAVGPTIVGTIVGRDGKARGRVVNSDEVWDALPDRNDDVVTQEPANPTHVLGNHKPSLGPTYGVAKQTYNTQIAALGSPETEGTRTTAVVTYEGGVPATVGSAAPVINHAPRPFTVTTIGDAVPVGPAVVVGVNQAGAGGAASQSAPSSSPAESAPNASSGAPAAPATSSHAVAGGSPSVVGNSGPSSDTVSSTPANAASQTGGSSGSSVASGTTESGANSGSSLQNSGSSVGSSSTTASTSSTPANADSGVAAAPDTGRLTSGPMTTGSPMPIGSAEPIGYMNDASVVDARNFDPHRSEPPPLTTSPKFVSDLQLKPPPPPSVSGNSPADPENGVRIAYDAAALEMVVETDTSFVDELELRLTSAATTTEVNDVLRWSDEEVAQRLLASNRWGKVDDVVVVSLRRLLEEAKKHTSHGNDLPEAVRRCDGLRRVYGFSVSADGDVSLIGSRSGSGDPLDIDELVIALRAGWRDAATPICSLDPDPTDFGGPQRARIEGIPRNSRFAQTMLEADYLMKAVNMGLTPTAVADFRTMKSAFDAAFSKTGASPANIIDELFFQCRFWFVPGTPRRGDIVRAADGRSYVFRSRMELKTEELRQGKGGFLGTGRSNPLPARVASSFNAHLDALEAEFPQFRRLHLLFDLMLAAELLRQEHAELSLLVEFCKLPTHEVAVPLSYPGLTLFVEAAGLRLPAVQGGVTCRILTSTRSVPQMQLPDLDRLLTSKTADDSAVVQESKPTLAVPALRREFHSSSKLAEAARLSALGRLREALDLIAESLAEEPDDLAARELRTKIYIGQKWYRLADRELETIWRLNRGDPRIRIARLHLLDQQGRLGALETISRSDRGQLAEQYFIQASESVQSGDFPAAENQLSRAAELDRNDGRFFELRVVALLLQSKADEAAKLLDERLAANSQDAQALRLRAVVLASTRRFEECIKAADASLQLDDRQPDMLLIRAAARFKLDPLATDSAIKDVKAALRLQPKHGKAHYLDGLFRALDGEYDAALAACSRALEASPELSEAYQLRVEIRLKKSSSARYSTEVWEDCTLALAIKPELWQLRSTRADALMEMARDAELRRRLFEQERFETLWLMGIAEHAAALPQLEKMSAMINAGNLEQDPDRAATFQALFVQTCWQAAAADLETAASFAPSQFQAELRSQREICLKAIGAAP